jgi:FAD synthetase
MKSPLIFNQNNIVKFLKLHQDKKLVLVGGCFDLLHIGHITFLTKARQKGDCLLVLLESDLKIKSTKGENRPINSQLDRAKILTSLRIVDGVLMLPDNIKDQDYDKLVEKIKPLIIATTRGDINISHKNRVAKKVGAKVAFVTPLIKDKSTSNMVKLLPE